MVTEAVERDLERFGALKDGALAAAALAMARELDDVGNSATSKSMCARALRELLDRLAELAPPEREADQLDDLNEQRRKRLERQSKTANSSRP